MPVFLWGVKERFRQLLEEVSPLEIAKIEQELIGEGMSREEIQRLCDVHLTVFKEQLEKQKVEEELPSRSTYSLKNIDYFNK